MIRQPKRHTLFYGGARSGKTVLVVKAIMHRAVVAPGSRHAMFRLQANSARASLWLETVPIVQKIWFPQFTLRDRIREYGYFEINETGSEVWITGTDDKERIEKILGKEFATLYFNECSQHRYPTIVTLLTRLAQKVYRKDNGRLLLQKAFYDLNPVGTRHFTALLFIRGVDPLTMRPLADMDQRQHAFINPKDNIDNLTKEFLDSLDAMPPRQRARFFEGVFQAEIDGALWTFDGLEACRVDAAPETLSRVVVAIDPSGTKGEADERSDAVGIVVAGKAPDGTAYVLADRTCNLPPEGWANVAVTAFHEFRADRIVAEANYGGDMVRSVIHARDRAIPVELVSASRGKAVRAEPVSALYGKPSRLEGAGWVVGSVRHVGKFLELEDEMLNFSSAGYLGARSPNRADALVWAITDLCLGEMKGWGIFELYRQRAAAAEAMRKGEPPPPPTEAAVEYAKRPSLQEIYDKARAEFAARKRF